MPVVLRYRENPSGTTSVRCDVSYKGSRKVLTYDELIPKRPDKTASDEEKRKWAKVKKRIVSEAGTWRDKLAVDVAYRKAGMMEHFEDGKLIRPYMEKWAADFKGTGFHMAASTVKAFLEFMPDHSIWADVTEDAINGFAQYLGGKKFTSGSIRNYIAYLRGLIRQAGKDKLTQLNVKTLQIEIPKGKASKEKADLTETDLRALVKAPCADSRVRIAFLFSCYTGLSFRDLLMLKKEHIQEVAGETGPILILIKPRSKNDNVQRVPLVHPTQLALLDLAVPNGEYVFDLASRFEFKQGMTARELKKMTHACYGSNNRKLVAWVKAAEIKKTINWHIGRHTFTTNLEGDLSMIMGMTGHTNERTTKGYKHQRLERSGEAVKKLPALDI